MVQLLFAFFVTGVAAENPGGCELAQLVAYHVVSYVHGDERLPVVYSDGLTYKIRRDLDHTLLIAFYVEEHSALQFVVDIRSFFQ
jgi:hypothetical protein